MVIKAMCIDTEPSFYKTNLITWSNLDWVEDSECLITLISYQKNNIYIIEVKSNKDLNYFFLPKLFLHNITIIYQLFCHTLFKFLHLNF